MKTGALYFSLQSQLPALRAHGLPPRLLHLELKRPQPESRVKTIRIGARTNGPTALMEGPTEQG